MEAIFFLKALFPAHPGPAISRMEGLKPQKLSLKLVFQASPHSQQPTQLPLHSSATVTSQVGKPQLVCRGRGYRQEEGVLRVLRSPWEASPSVRWAESRSSFGGQAQTTGEIPDKRLLL